MKGRVAASILPLTLTALLGIAVGPVRAALAGGESQQAGVVRQGDQFGVAFQAWNTLYKQALVGSGRPDAKLDSVLPIANDALTAWLGLLDQFYGHPPSAYAADANWRRDLATVTGYLEIGCRLLASGHIAEAHKAFGPVRSVLLDLRRRNGISYYGDVLFEYHNAMEAVCDPIIADPRSVTRGSLPNIARGLRDARAMWQRVLDFGFAPVESDREKHREFREFVEAESRALSEFEAVVASGDLSSFASVAQEVKACYRALYLAFG